MLRRTLSPPWDKDRAQNGVQRELHDALEAELSRISARQCAPSSIHHCTFPPCTSWAVLPCLAVVCELERSLALRNTVRMKVQG